MGRWSIEVLSTLAPARGSVHANGCRRREAAIRPHSADAVPRVFLVRRLALPLVALEEAGHEEFLCQRRELHAAGLSIFDDPVLVVELDHFDDGAGLRRVVDDLVTVGRPARSA